MTKRHKLFDKVKDQDGNTGSIGTVFRDNGIDYVTLYYDDLDLPCNVIHTDESVLKLDRIQEEI